MLALLSRRESRVRTTRSLIAALVMVAPGIVLAQQGASGAPPKQTDGQASKAAADDASVTRAKDVVARARSAYLALKSYSDTTTVHGTWKAKDTPEQEFTLPVGNAFVAPHSLAAASKDAMLLCDGEKVYQVVPAAKQFTQQTMPDKFDPQMFLEDLPGGQWLIAPQMVFLPRGQDNPELMFRTIQTLTGARPEVRDGVAGTVVTATGPSQEGVPGPTTEMFFRDDNGLLASVSYDYTATSNAAESDARWERVRYSYTIADIKTDPVIAADAFAPPKGYAKVDILATGAPSADRPDQVTLVGAPAPELEGDALEGKAPRLADLKGRVVLMDFWATWCGPCVMAIPHIQKLSDQFADKPVTVIGINQDQGDKDLVSKFVKDKKITLRQLMDDGSVGEKYAVTAIPCLVLIDQKGVVQDVTVGYRNGEEEDLAQKIQKLLDGKPLHTAQELEAMRAKAKAEHDQPALSMDSFDPDRFEVGKAGTTSYVSDHISWITDVDGQPGNELVCPGNDNELEVVDSTGEHVQRIRFGGLGHGRIESVASVEVSGQRDWFLAFNELGQRPFKTIVGLYTETGKEIWRYEPEIPGDNFVQTQVAAGDVTGDGSPEMVVGITVIRETANGLKHGAGNEAGAVIVLSADGKRLIQRPIGPVGLVFVGKPKEKGAPGVVLASVNGRLMKLTVKQDAKPEQPASK